MLQWTNFELCFCFLCINIQKWTAGSYGSSIFNLTVFHSGCTNLHFYQHFIKVPFFSTTSPILIISCLFDDSCSNRWEVLSHYGFDLNFPVDWWCWISFLDSISHQYVFFVKISTQILCSFIIGLFCYCIVWVLYVL